MTPSGYLVLTGSLVLVGKSPDGDSVRFAPDEPARLRELVNGERVRVSGDGTVQLRFDGVDAPELHYQGRAQPLAAVARDALLEHLGFERVSYDRDVVTAATPSTLPAVVLSRFVEVNGRPVAFVLTGGPVEGPRADLTEDLLAATANAWLLETGAAYALAYTSTDAPAREQLAAASRRARDAGLGVWAADSSARFLVREQDDLGPYGALVLPKLFRRATDWLRTGGGLTLPQWLQADADTRDDLVQVGGAPPVRLSSLLEQDGDELRLTADPLDLVFVER